MNKLIQNGIIILVLLTAVSANAELPELDVDSSISLYYEPFSGLPSSQTLNIRLLSTLDLTTIDPALDNPIITTEILTLRIKPSDNGSFDALGDNQTSLPIALESIDSSDLTKVNSEYRQTLVISKPFIEALELEYQLFIPESIYAEPGLYELDLDVELLNSEDEMVGSSKSLLIEVQVDPKLQTNIAGTKGNYEDGETFSVIDFEKLTTNESKRVFIQVRGNAPATITVSSENQGKMIHKDKPELFVEYDVEVDGIESTLSTPLSLSRSVAKDLQGSAYPMKVTIGDVDNAFSGEYQDIITVDVNPQ